jgi:hypothetical protein
MESKVHRLNRKKLHRFLDSLRVHTVEEIHERRRMIDGLAVVQARYEDIREAASATLVSREHYPARYQTFRSHTETAPARTYETAPRETSPLYVPASKFPLPMKPPPFLTKRDSRNASRVLQLSHLRPDQPHSEVDLESLVEPANLPRLQIDKLA